MSPPVSVFLPRAASLQAHSGSWPSAKLDQIEPPHENRGVVVPIADALEHCDAVLLASHCFAIYDARPSAPAREGLDDEREALGEVIAGAAVEPHAPIMLPAR